MVKQNKILGLALIISTTLTSCMLGPNFHSPSAPDIVHYTPEPLPVETVSSPTPSGNSQHFDFGKEIPAKWWVLFHSEGLNRLINKGFANNPTVEGAQAALRVAQANLRAQIGQVLMPAVDAQAFANKQRLNGATAGIPAAPMTFDLYNTQVNVTYTLDVFGGGRRQIEASRAQRDFQVYELEATYLTLAANIATTAITQAQYRAQLKATADIIALQKDLLVITRGQFELGGASRSDVLSQESQLAQTVATLPPLEKNLAQINHALSVLLGEFPSEDRLPLFVLDELQLPSHLPVSLPSQLVSARPDIKAQAALLHQASAQIGVATTNLLPQFTLTGFDGWQANSLGHFFSPVNNIWSITAQVLQPVFRGGALLAQRDSAIAAFDQAKAAYRQTVLQAFQNVADALRAIELDAKLLKAQVEAEKSAYDLLTLTKGQFELGAVNYLSLLNAERQYQTAVINRISAQALRYVDTVALFQALGGGWWTCGEDKI